MAAEPMPTATPAFTSFALRSSLVLSSLVAHAANSMAFNAAWEAA